MKNKADGDGVATVLTHHGSGLAKQGYIVPTAACRCMWRQSPLPGLRRVARPRRSLLIVIVGILVASALAIAVANVVVWLYPSHYADPVPITLSAVLIAMAGLFITIQWKFADKEDDRSRFYLEKALAGWDRAFEILQETLVGPIADRRTKWIAAARILERSRRLSTKVSEASHLEALEIELTYQRQKFHQFFEQPAPFYYGVSLADVAGFPEEEKLNEAGRRATVGSDTTISTLHQIPETAIYTIWRALQYPPDYWDVIDKGAQFDEGPLMFINKGLREYIEHARAWHSAAGKLWPRNTKEAS